jgi:hypothetical protein
MRRDWLNTEFGMNFAAIGLVSVCVALPCIIIQDIWFVATGVSTTLWAFDEVVFDLAAGVAAVFWVINIFVFRPGLPKYVAVVLVISFASYVFQPLLPLHAYREVAVLCIARTIGCLTILLLAWVYHRDLKAGKVSE